MKPSSASPRETDRRGSISTLSLLSEFTSGLASSSSAVKWRHLRFEAGCREEKGRGGRRGGGGWEARRPAGHEVGGHARGASELLKSALSLLYQRTALPPNRIRVNKLIGDLHSRFLEQGSNKVILAFSPPFSIVSFQGGP